MLQTWAGSGGAFVEDGVNVVMAVVVFGHEMHVGSAVFIHCILILKYIFSNPVHLTALEPYALCKPQFLHFLESN